MPNAVFQKFRFAIFLVGCASLLSPTATTSADKRDFSKESVVVERTTSNLVFQNDGTYTNDQFVRAIIQSDAGVRQYGVLTVPYPASSGTIEITDVRVTKPDGTVITTPLDTAQDMTSEISRMAPTYTDMRELHLPVKGLEPGDTLEYALHFVLHKPLIPGQIWVNTQLHQNIVMPDEEVEIDVPRERSIKWKSRTGQPTIREEGSRRIYSWKYSNLESRIGSMQPGLQDYDLVAGLLAPADVMLSSFSGWEEMGRWYEALQREKVEPSPEVIAKARELTRGLTDDEAKIRAIYNYVSLRYRYISISFGVGRYQPHAAAEILGNQYGDCKDKHTLLAALLSALGIHAYPALINSQGVIDQDVPSPAQFDHVITVVHTAKGLSWMDATAEVTPMGYLAGRLRGKPALVIMPDKVAFLTTPSDLPRANLDNFKVTAQLDSGGTLQAHSETVFRGDSEPYFRTLFRRVPEPQWKEYAQRFFYGARLGGIITSVHPSLPEKTDEPFTLTYDYTLKDFSGGDHHRFVIPLPPTPLSEVKDEDLQRTTPIWLGDVGESTYDSVIELPQGWSAAEPMPLDLKEDFAEFHGTTEVHDNILTTRRSLRIKVSALQPDQLPRYRGFQKAISDNHRLFIFLRTGPGAASAPAAPDLPAAANVWTDAEKAHFHDCMAKNRKSGETANQFRSDALACTIYQEQEHWTNLHPEVAGKPEDFAKFMRCLGDHKGELEQVDHFHSTYDTCLRQAYALPPAKQ